MDPKLHTSCDCTGVAGTAATGSRDGSAGMLSRTSAGGVGMYENFMTLDTWCRIMMGLWWDYDGIMMGLWWDYDGMGCMIHSCMDIIRSMCLYIILMIWINMIFIRFIDVGNLGYSRVISEALEISIEKKFLKGWVWHILTAFFWWLDAFGPFGELPNLNIDGVRKSDHHLWPGQLRSLLSWQIHPSLGRSPHHCPVSHVFKSWK